MNFTHFLSLSNAFFSNEQKPNTITQETMLIAAFNFMCTIGAMILLQINTQKKIWINFYGICTVEISLQRNNIFFTIFWFTGTQLFQNFRVLIIQLQNSKYFDEIQNKSYETYEMLHLNNEHAVESVRQYTWEQPIHRPIFASVTWWHFTWDHIHICVLNHIRTNCHSVS